MEGKGDRKTLTNPQDDTTSLKRKSRTDDDNENIDLQHKDDEVMPEAAEEDVGDVHGQDARTGSESAPGPATLKSMLTKDMLKLKQQRESCPDENDERVLDNMLDSYKEAISILNDILSEEEQYDVVKQSQPDNPDSSMLARMAQHKDSTANPEQHDVKRGCYKRKLKAAPTWSVHVRVGHLGDGFHDDGYAWRKYGQKNILRSIYPRGYYRCAHKFEGCKATKQIQRLDEDPEMLQVVYRGEHTCDKQALMTPQSEMASSEDPWDVNSNDFDIDDLDIDAGMCDFISTP